MAVIVPSFKGPVLAKSENEADRLPELLKVLPDWIHRGIVYGTRTVLC